MFRSDLDAELIAELIGLYIDKGFAVAEATKQVLSRLDGSWALAVIDKVLQTSNTCMSHVCNCLLFL